MSAASLPGSRKASSAVGRLPADLAKLRERFLADYPAEVARVDLLSQVPAALRHVLSMRLELDRADALPRHYRDLAAATLRGAAMRAHAPDAVDQLVTGYAAAVCAGKPGDAAGLLPQLRRYFTEPQIVELALTLSLARAFSGFDALLGVEGQGAPPPPSSHLGPKLGAEPPDPQPTERGRPHSMG